MAIATPRPWSRWNVQQRVFALLLGALAAMAVAAGISVSLAPARISFSVANVTTSRVPVQGSPGLLNGFYNLTLVANNTSRRTQVRFAAVSAQIWYSATGYVLAGEVSTPPPRCRGGGARGTSPASPSGPSTGSTTTRPARREMARPARSSRRRRPPSKTAGWWWRPR